MLFSIVNLDGGFVATLLVALYFFGIVMPYVVLYLAFQVSISSSFKLASLVQGGVIFSVCLIAWIVSDSIEVTLVAAITSALFSILLLTSGSKTSAFRVIHFASLFLILSLNVTYLAYFIYSLSA